MLSIGITEADFKSARHTERGFVWRRGLWEYSEKKKLEIGEDCFIAPVINKIELLNSDAVISDVRTFQELKALRNIKSLFIIVVRDFEKDFSLGGPIIETKIDLKYLLGNAVVFNTGDLIDLNRKIDQMIKIVVLTKEINGPER